jgi:4-amino-4-deoxy-L-arabinose transferase-like glycosyltransferase
MGGVAVAARFDRNRENQAVRLMRAFAAVWSARRIALGLGAAAGLCVLATLGGPGITIDEPLDVRPGRTYVTTLLARGWGFFDRKTVIRVFADNAEHPPLGRWLLGIASTLAEPFEGWFGGADPYSVHAGRVAPALAFACLVGLVTAECGRRFGRAAGVAAGFSLMAMPRVFAHAHLAALDSFLCLFWMWALLSAVRAVEGKRLFLAIAGAGFLWGLALLVKIHAWLLPPVVALWALSQLKPIRALAALSLWTIAGLSTFFLGWPWLWYDTAHRLKAYLFRTSLDRLTLRVQYFGTIYADRDVPWHYPWFYFAVTVPVGLHLLGAMGLWREARSRASCRFLLVPTGAILMFLALFSTRVAVYDGERLFLVAFPLWALLIGRGFASAWSWAQANQARKVVLVGFLLVQASGTITMHPFGLSYYNLLAGGLPGAERLGLELTYWGDTIDPILLDRLAKDSRPGDTAALAPTLHHIQARACTTQALLERKMILNDESAVRRSDWVVIYRRTAYWKPEIAQITQRRPDYVRARQGVWLSGLWRQTSRP